MTRRNVVLFWLATPVAIILLLGGVLSGRDRLAFRDVSHFYIPLYQYVAERCHDEWLPLWNPLDQTGIPLVGETTTAVFYPVRYVLFSLPTSASLAVAWYVAIHLVIASLTAVVAARAMKVGRPASMLAGVMYPMSGSIWFLYTNPPYLVAAAWMPLVMAMLLKSGGDDRGKRIVIGGSAMAMMILGGDPQAALHTMMLCSAVMIWRLIRRTVTTASLAVLMLVPMLAACLSAPQLAASLSWSNQSDRVSPDLEARRFTAPIVGGKRHQAQQYSLPPWHIAELVTPNAYGSMLPVYRRLSRLIPGDGRVWTPSIYLGMLAAIALLDRLLRLRSQRIDAPLGIAIASLALASGHFGLVWWIQASTGVMSQVDSSVGGPYWLLYQFFPGYDSFRYPAKWLTFFSLAVAILSAQWLDAGRWKFVKFSLRLVAIVLASGFTVVLYLGWFWLPNHTATPLPFDVFWGPLDFVGGLKEIRISIVHSVIVLLAIRFLVRWSAARHWTRAKTAEVFCLLTLLDLSMVAIGNTYTVNVASEDRLLSSATVERPDGVHRWMRTQADGGWPEIWQRSADEDRLLEVEVSQRLSWFGRWHLTHNAAVLNNMVSIDSKSMAVFWNSAKIDSQSMLPGQRRSHWKQIRHRYRVDGVIHSNDKSAVVDAKSLQLVDVAFWADQPIKQETRQGQMIIRPVYQDGHWTARCRIDDDAAWQPIAVQSHDELMQSTTVPEGMGEVEFRYRPWWLVPSLAVCVFAWMISLLLALRVCTVSGKHRRLSIS
ncbi:hypothetical protein [Rubripirellula reticaptiva]|nr:hypothetical protein [Rubripirellula reticaptiva]